MTKAAQTPEEKEERKRRQRAASAAYYLKNADRLRATARAYVAAHRQERRDYSKKWAAENPDRARAIKANWDAQNVERVKAYGKQYYVDNRQARIDYSKKFALENPEVVRAKRVRYRSIEANKEREKRVYKEWYAKNPEQTRAKTKAYRKANNDRILTRNQNRRAAMNGAKLSLDIAPKLLLLQQDLCAACRADLRTYGYHIDHIVALINGGLNEDANVQLLCPTCNLSKGRRHMADFMQGKGFLL